jgi:hypothetical protein
MSVGFSDWVVKLPNCSSPSQLTSSATEDE